MRNLKTTTKQQKKTTKEHWLNLYCVLFPVLVVRIRDILSSTWRKFQKFISWTLCIVRRQKRNLNFKTAHSLKVSQLIRFVDIWTGLDIYMYTHTFALLKSSKCQTIAMCIPSVSNEFRIQRWLISPHKYSG